MLASCGDEEKIKRTWNALRRVFKNNVVANGVDVEYFQQTKRFPKIQRFFCGDI